MSPTPALFTLNLYVALAAPLVGSAIAAGAARFAAGDAWGVSPSACPACGRRLGVVELIPVASWVLQRGRCRGCSASISPAYPLIELSAAVMALWAWLAVSPEAFIPSCLMGWLVLALSVNDMRTRRLPDALNLTLALAGLSVAMILDRGRFLEHVAGGVAGFAGLVAIELSYRALRGQEGIGRGDAKLMGALGAWVGIKSLAACLLLAASGAVAAILLSGWLGGRKITADTSLPFGPFLAAAGWVTWLYGITLI